MLTAIILNFVGAGTSLAIDKTRQSVVDYTTPTSDPKEFSWNFCENVSGSTSTTSGSDFSCNQICPTDYEPICASDGVTYANSCLHSIAQCKITDLILSGAGE